MKTNEKQYQGFRTLVGKFGIREAINYKVLESLDKNPILNKSVGFYSPLKHRAIVGSTLEDTKTLDTESYVAKLSRHGGRLIYFNPNPDITKGDSESLLPKRWTKERKQRANKNKVSGIFTKTVGEILNS